MSEVLRVEVADAVATVTLDRPQARNALDAELAAAIPQALHDLDARDDVRVIVLTGADPAFCAGFDLRAHAAARPDEQGRRPPGPGATIWHPFGFAPHDTPVIGAVNGAAVTGGFELALACDFLIASERARFADTHARVGALPGWGLSIRLPELVGINRARQLSLTGDFIDAARALDWGLVNEVVPHEQLLPRCREIAASIASIPAETIAEVRDVYAQVALRTGEDAWRYENRRAIEWMQGRFDRERLARERERIMERGRGSAERAGQP